MKKLTYTCLVIMRTNALWAAETAWGNGIHSEAIRYYKIMNYIEKRMWNYPSHNELIL